MKRNTSVLIGIIVIVVVVAGGYAIFHKSPKTTTTSTSTAQSKAPAVNDAILITKTSATLGQYLAEPSGQALYTYNADTVGVSNCTGTCLSNWPPYQAKGATTNLPANVATITRTDNGETQYTYQGKPLYTFIGDTNGQVTGNGVDNFKLATPATTSSSSSTTTTTPAQSTTNSPSSNNY